MQVLVAASEESDATVKRDRPSPAPIGDLAQHRPSTRRGPVVRRTPRIDGYVDLDLVATGGSSTVYSGTESATGSRIALKVLSLSADGSDRFDREVRILQRLDGVAGIVAARRATITADGRPVIAMDLLSGGSLKDRLASGPLPPTEVVSMGITLATALGVAHRLGVVHRDLKPANILFDAAGAPVLADFGIAIAGDRPASTTTSNSLSPPHAPPERFGEDVAVDPRLGDVYSLASTLHTALAGAPPFGTAERGGIAGLICRVVEHPVPTVERADLPPGLESVLRTAMAKEPGRRYRSMALLAADLYRLT